MGGLAMGDGDGVRIIGEGRRLTVCRMVQFEAR